MTAATATFSARKTAAPRSKSFFGSLESYEKYAGRNGFYLDFGGAGTTMYGTVAGKSYKLMRRAGQDYARFDNGSVEIRIRNADHAVVAWELKPGIAAPQTVDMLPYYQLKFLMNAVSNPRHVHYANVAGLSGEHVAKKGAVQG
jgi:hypothetical protein